MDKKVLHGSLQDLAAKEDDLIQILLNKVHGGQDLTSTEDAPHIERTSIAAVIDDTHQQQRNMTSQLSGNTSSNNSTSSSAVCAVCGTQQGDHHTPEDHV